MGGFLSRRRKAWKAESKAAKAAACGGTGETLAPAAGEPDEGKDSAPQSDQPTLSKMSDEKSLSNESANQGTSEDQTSQNKETLKQKLRLSRGRVRPRSAQTKPDEETSKPDLTTQCSFFNVTDQAGQQDAPKTRSTAIDWAAPSYSDISFIDKSDDQDQKEGGDSKVMSSPSQPMPDQSNSEQPAAGVNKFDDLKLESMEDDVEENTASQEGVTAAEGDGGGRQSSTPTQTQLAKKKDGDEGKKESPKAGRAPSAQSAGAQAPEYVKAAKPRTGKNKNRDSLSYEGGSTKVDKHRMITGINSEQMEDDRNRDGSVDTNGDDRFNSSDSRADDQPDDQDEEDDSIEQWMYYGERQDTPYNTSARGYEYPSPHPSVSPGKEGAHKPLSPHSSNTDTEVLPNRSSTRLIYVRSHHLVETDSEEENTKEYQDYGSYYSAVQIGDNSMLLGMSGNEPEKEPVNAASTFSSRSNTPQKEKKKCFTPSITSRSNTPQKENNKCFSPDAMDAPSISSRSNTPKKEKKKSFSPDAMDAPTRSRSSRSNTPRKEEQKSFSPDAMETPTRSRSSRSNTPQTEEKIFSPDAMDAPNPGVTCRSNTPRKATHAMDAPTSSGSSRSNTPRNEEKKRFTPDAMDATPGITSRSNTPRKATHAMDAPTSSGSSRSNTPRNEEKKRFTPDAMDATPGITSRSNTPRKATHAMDAPTSSGSSRSNTPQNEEKKRFTPDAMDAHTPGITSRSNTPWKATHAMDAPTSSGSSRSNTPWNEEKKSFTPDAMDVPTPSVNSRSNTPRKEKKKSCSPDAMDTPTPSVTSRSNTPRKEEKKSCSPDAMDAPTPSMTSRSNTPRKEERKSCSPDAMDAHTPSMTSRSNTPRKDEKKGCSPDAMDSGVTSRSNTPRKEEKKSCSPDAMDAPTPDIISRSNTPRKEKKKKKSFSLDAIDAPTPGVTSRSNTPHNEEKKGFSSDAMDAQEKKSQVKTENADDLLAGNSEEMSAPQETKDTANISNSSAVTENDKYPNEAKSGDTTMSMGDDETTKGVVEMQEGETMTMLLLRRNLPCEGREDVKKGAGDGANMSEDKDEVDERASIGITTMLHDRSKSSCQLEDLQAENSGIENAHSIEPYYEQMFQTEQATENDSSVACAATDDEPQAQPRDEKEDEGLAGKAVPQDGAAVSEWKMMPAHQMIAQTNLGAPQGSLPPLRPRTSFIRPSRTLRGEASPRLAQVKHAALIETTAQSLSGECRSNQDEINKMFDARPPGSGNGQIERNEENGEIQQGRYELNEEMQPSVNESNEMDVTEIPEGSLGLQGNSINTAPAEEQANSDPLAEAADPKDEPDAPEHDDNATQE